MTSTTTGRSSREAPSVTPGWLDATVLAAGLGALALAIPGLVLAIANTYSLAPALIGAVLLAVPAMAVVAQARRAGPADRSAHLAAAGAVVLAVGLFVFNAWAPAQHVFVDRDPGAYTTAGRWLARDGTLQPTVAVGAFAGVDGLRFSSIAVPSGGEGTVQIQFNHTLPVLLAQAYGVAGHRALFRVPALLSSLGLLAVFSVAARVLRRPWLALGVMAAVGLALPQVAFARDTFSEPATQLWLWSGILALLLAYERRSWRFGAAAGLLLGATAMARIDGLAYLAPLPVLAVLAIRAAPPADRPFLARAAWALAAGAVVTGALGWLDLAVRGSAYEESHAGPLGQLRLALLASMLAAAALWFTWDRAAPARGWLADHRRPIGRAAAGLTLVVLALAWFVRPVVQEAHSPVSSGLIGQLQEAEGVEVEPNRSYDEDTLRWIAWYLGPVTLAVAIVGAARAARRISTGPAHPALLGTVLVAAPAALIYLWRPNAAPDQIWVMRRFVPAALPLFALFAALALAAIVRAASGSARRPLLLGAVGLVGVAGLAWPIASTWPVRLHHEQRPFLVMVEGTCAIAGPDAAILFVDDGSPISGVISGGLPMSLRAWCGVPVAVAEPGFGETRIAALAEAWRAAGRTLVLAAPGSSLFGSLTEGRTVQNSPFVVNDRALERSLTGRPNTYRSEQIVLTLLRLD